MDWTIEWSERSLKDLQSLEKQVRNRVYSYLDVISKLPNPRLRGRSLTGNLDEYWRYRIGDYRVICDIQDNRLIVLILQVGHRRDIYKRRSLMR
ncbi:addiction module toxin, RelE/StbE family [Jonquetella anthropi DSM 22815]|uniref:Addiction module toxin, RelE/StbE family n=1 Tax=Jonquetella anthropi DSM 22815 TaxID=885272 RepID=H0ULV8_9BACT|nr:type II toxin-antitoxin system RelE/ParE family toxin [Jonquetella anthropi]EHM13599.1 addiction module toxin, RelE/StbE family [Jonquetella anthropi DSM 22815]